jgi:hypothetical protein
VKPRTIPVRINGNPVEIRVGTSRITNLGHDGTPNCPADLSALAFRKETSTSCYDCFPFLLNFVFRLQN